jgi:hypothetical protein
MTAIAAIEQGSWPVRVLVSVTDLPDGSVVELYRQVAGVRTLVRAGYVASSSGGAVLRTDAELPFGVPVSYVAVVDGTDEYATSATTYVVTGGRVAVTDAVAGTAAEVTVLAWGEKAHDADNTLFRVSGRTVVVGAPLAQPTSAVELFTLSSSSAANLTTVVKSATSGVVQFRQPGGYDGVDGHYAVLRLVERRWSQDGSDERRRWILDLAETDGWAPILEAAGYTLQDIADVYDGLTLDDLATDFTTLLDVAQGVFEA